MRYNSVILVTVFSVITFIFSCGGTSETNVNSNSRNTNVAANNANNPLAVVTPSPEQTTNNAPTLTPVYKAYCAAMVRKDEAAVRKTYSQDTIKFFEEEMKSSGEKSLIKFLQDDQVSEKLCEVRNEQIKGDTAVAEIRSEGYPNGIKVVFVKENGEWKLTNKSPALDSVKKGLTNSTK